MTLFKRKKRYSKIPYEKRIKLIELVDEEKLFIYQAAQRLRIKLPTAKVILQNYRKTGRIFQKKIDEKQEQSGIEELESQSQHNESEGQKALENENQVSAINPMQFYVFCPFPPFLMM